MAGILEKRQSLHGKMDKLEQQNTDLQAQIDQMQPLVNLGLVSAMIAHEINNILTPLGNYAQLAEMHPDDTELAKKAISKTASNTARAAKILDAMLAMANGKKHEMAAHPLKEMTEEIFSCLARDFSKDMITVNTDIPDDLTVFVDRICFQQVLMNLIINAREALVCPPDTENRTSRGGKLTITAEKNCQSITINVADTAHGISEEHIDSIFDPFFTTKTGDKNLLSKSGAGLGLPFCKRIVNAHNGTIDVNSQPGSGTIFTITLPVNN